MIAADKPPLKEAYLEHISARPWSTYTEADYNVEQWHNACLIHQHDGAPTSKTLCKLPVRTPNGAINRNGVHAALAALNGARGGVNATQEQKDKARRALIRLYGELGESAPSSLNHQDSVDDFLAHFGIKGMHWGSRKDDHPEVSRKTNKDASRDAAEFARAKVFHGEGAGTRRKLIKTTVEAKSKQNADYKKAFDHHLDRQDMSKHVTKAKSERSRKDTKAAVGKNARAINRAINGPFAGPVAAAAVLGLYGAARSSGMDRKILSVGKGVVNRVRYGTTTDLSFLKGTTGF
jgi:hypothetical protein